MSGAAASVTRAFTIVNKLGLHARPAALFVKTACQFRSDIHVETDGHRVSGKSILGLLTIEGYQGKVLHVTATGPDADAALDALGEVIAKKFHED